MKAKDIDKVYNEVSELLAELAIISIEHGYHLDHDLEKASFSLYLEKDINELVRINFRLKSAISKIKDGTFKLSAYEEELERAIA